MSKADIILVKPGSQRSVYGELSSLRFTAIEPPFWAALLASYLRREGYGVSLIDAEAEDLTASEVAARIRDRKPALAALMIAGSNPSASTMNMAGVGNLVAQVRQAAPEAPTLVAGLHPSALPGRTLLEEKPDYVCQGEGFFTFPALLDALSAGADPSGIPGLWTRKDGRVQGGPRPPVWEDLDTLPMPAWDLLPMHRYRAHAWHCFGHVDRREPYGVLYTSLGCPFECSFCCVNSFFGGRGIRYRGLDAVLAEIDVLALTYGIRNIKIMDEMFALGEQRVLELCEAIAARKYNLNFWAYARVNTVSARMLAAMKRAGINWVAYGFESGSKRVLADVHKGYRLEEVERVVRMTRDQGQHICANYIFGLPEDDAASLRETLDFMLSINAEWANIYSAMAYPGSRLHALAVESGWPLPATWQGYSQYSEDCLPLPTRHLTGGQVLAFRDEAFNAYYRRQSYLDLIQEAFGPETMRHVRQMASRTLVRRHAQPLDQDLPRPGLRPRDLGPARQCAPARLSPSFVAA